MTLADHLEERLGDLAVALASLLSGASPASEAALGEALVPLLIAWLDFVRTTPEDSRPAGDLAAAARAFAARTAALGLPGERLAEGFRALRELAWERALDRLPADAANFLRLAARLDEAVDLMLQPGAPPAAPGPAAAAAPSPPLLPDPLEAERQRLEVEIADLLRLRGALADEAHAHHRALVAALEHEVEWQRRQREVAQEVAELERRLARIGAVVREARTLLERLADTGAEERPPGPEEAW